MAMAMAPAATLFASSEVSAAPGDPGEPVVIGVTGDFGWNNPPALAQHRQLVRGVDPDFIVTTGDNVQTNLAPVAGTDMYDFTVGRGFCDFLAGAAPGPFCSAEAQGATNRFFPAAGNHDHIEGDGGGPISNFTSYFNLPGAGRTGGSVPSGSELYYDVVLGPVHVFVLDSDPMLLEAEHELDATQGEIPGYTTSPIAQQRAWLEAAMTASDAPWKVVAMHHSPYSSAPLESGSGYGSSPWVQWPYDQWGADLVLSGHHNTYERVLRDGVQYVTNGMGGGEPRTFSETPVEGSQIRFNEDTTVVTRLSATNNTLSLEAHDLNGAVVDRITAGVAGPTAVATATVDSEIAPVTAQLNGSASANPAGGTPTYEWDTDGDGAFDDATGATPQLTFADPTVAKVRLKVTDANGVSSVSETLTINVAAAIAPANTVPPVVTGSAVVGATLTANTGTWTGTTPITHATQWQRCLPATAPAYTTAVSADSPVLQWRLAEGSGTTAADASGNNRPGTYVGTVQRNRPSALNTDTNAAVGFDGGTGRVEAAALTGLPTAAISAEMWVKTSDQKNSGLISYAVAANSDEFHVTNPDSLTVAVVGTRVDTGVAVNDNQWHHVVATWSNDTGTVNLYVDGTPRYSLAGVRTGGALTDGGTMVIGQEQDTVGGGFDSSQALQGQLDEVALYPVALSAARVAEHHLAAQGQTCTNIAGATGTAYTVQPGDEGSRLRAMVTATNAKRSSSVPSASVGPVTVAAVDPVGALDAPASPLAGQVKVSGWAADPNEPNAPLSVDVYIGGAPGAAGVEMRTVTANTARAGVPAEYPGNHGFEATITTAKRGVQQVCVVARNVGAGANTQLGCGSVTIADPNPFGHYERVTSPKAGQISVRGWALDRSAPTSSLKMQVVVGGPRGTRGAEGYIIDANRRRDDVARSYPGTGSNHGFEATINTKKRGTQQVCVYALNTGTGQDTLLGCRTVDIVVK
jgi:PKD repeat protein